MSILAFALAAAVQAAAPAPAAAPLSFDPFTVEVNVAYRANRSVAACAVTLHGAPDAHWVDNACRNIGDAAFLALLGAPEDAPGRMTVLLALEAAGRGEGPATPPQGRMTFRSEARFAVTPAGAVARCTPGETAGQGQSIDLCLAGLPSHIVFAPAGGERTGRLTLSAYTSAVPGRDEAP
jgi:hypothetical protein